MFRWCSYCQRFINEEPPYQSVEVTHGICRTCVSQGATSPADALTKLHLLRNLREGIREAGHSGAFERVDELIDQALAGGLRPIDTVFGLLAPLLAEVGELWKEGRCSVSDEHRFSAFADAYLHAVRFRQLKSGSPDKSGSPVLLACAGENQHSFGIRAIQLWLETEGIGCEAVHPGVPPLDLLRYASTIDPIAIGISISMIDQITSLREFLELAGMSENIRHVPIVVGGYAVKTGIVWRDDLPLATLSPNVGAFRDWLLERNVLDRRQSA